METNTKSVEELDGLRASLSRLLVEADKVRFAVSQIALKQSVLDVSLQEKLDDADKTLMAACSSLSLLTAAVFNYE